MSVSDCDRDQDYIVEMDLEIPGTHAQTILPFRVTPQQMQNAVVTFRAIKLNRQRIGDQVRMNHLRYDQALPLRLLIGMGIVQDTTEISVKHD